MILKKAENIFSEFEFFPIKKDGKKFYIEVYENISNGFPSPAEDFSGRRISLDERFLSKPESTYIGKAKGMSNYPFILPGDFLIICADEEVKHGKLAMIYIPGEGFTAKVVDMEKSCLIPLNKEFPKIEFQEDEVVETRGVISATFREFDSLNLLNYGLE